MPQRSPAQRPVLLVEDDRVSCNALSSILRRRGFEVIVATTLAEGFARLSENPTHIILDLMLPDGDGEDILRLLRRNQSPAKVLVTTAVNDQDRLRSVREQHPDAILQKPIDLSKLLRMLEPLH
jgi:DNA-binding response OmpR family regulator